jgi:hypothetical protein
MFPLNQDTFVEYSGNTANDLYADGFGYIYMMKEGRGRSNSGGNFMLSKSIDEWYFELNSLVEDGSDLFAGGSYHGNTLTRKKTRSTFDPLSPGVETISLPPLQQKAMSLTMPMVTMMPVENGRISPDATVLAGRQP